MHARKQNAQYYRLENRVRTCLSFMEMMWLTVQLSNNQPKSGLGIHC